MKLFAVIAIVGWSLLSVGQEIQVSEVPGAVSLSIAAQKPYKVMTGQPRLPVLTLQCTSNGKKNVHVLTFSPGGNVSEADLSNKNDRIPLAVALGHTHQPTVWIPYGNGVSSTFAYYGKTEPERLKFLQWLFTSDSPTVTISFTPFLTGDSVTSVFDLTQMRDEVGKHPECRMQ